METIEKIRVWHVVWDNGRTNRLGLRYNHDHETISLGILYGQHLPIFFLESVLDRAFPDWKAKSEKLHLARVNPWIIEKSTSRYGSTNYILRYLKNPFYYDAPIGAVLHVSCANKISGFSMWLGDLAPIMAKVREDFQQQEADIIEVVEINTYRDFYEPGTPSGLIEK